MALGEGCSVTQAVMAHRRGPCGPKWRMALPLKVGSFNSQERAPAPRPPFWVLLHAPWSCWVAGQRPQSGVSWFLPDWGVEVIWENCGFQTGLCFSSALTGRKLCSLMVSPFHPGVLTHRKCPPRPFLMWPLTPLPGLSSR